MISFELDQKGGRGRNDLEGREGEHAAVAVSMHVYFSSLPPGSIHTFFLAREIQNNWNGADWDSMYVCMYTLYVAENLTAQKHKFGK